LGGLGRREAPDARAEAAGCGLRLILGLTQVVLVLGVGRDYEDLGIAAPDHIYVHHLAGRRIVHVSQELAVLVGALLVEL
jgi:hypothetical protein